MGLAHRPHPPGSVQTGPIRFTSLSRSTPDRPTLPLVVITVAYDSQAAIEQLASDLARQNQAPQQWLVVDNAPLSAPLLVTPPLQTAAARRLQGREGAGFGAGCNQAFESLAAEAWQGWVWLLNPDTRLTSPDVLARLTALQAALSPQAVLGTAVFTSEGKLEADGGWIDAGLAFRRRRLGPELLEAGRHQPLAVDWLSGCSLALQPGAHVPPARFDPAFPLYYEDMDLCLRLGQGGAPVLWSAAVAIEHQRSTGSGGSGERRLRLSTISYWHFLQRHCPAWVRALRGLRLVLMALIKLPRQPARSCSVLQGWLQALGDPIR